MILSSPDALTIGASGAIFGLMGALLVISHVRGISVMQSGIGPMILLNLAITFTIPGISIGGHIGGLDRRRGDRLASSSSSTSSAASTATPCPIAAFCVVAFVVLLVVSFALARSKYPLV